MTTPTIPFDEEAELAVLGAMAMSVEAARTAVERVTAEDFHRPALAAVFTALANLHTTGQPTDHISLKAELQRAGVFDAINGEVLLITIKTHTPAPSSVGRYAEIVVGAALRRRLMTEAQAILDAATDPTRDPGELLDAARASLGEIDTPLIGRDPDDESLEEFVARASQKPTRWLVRGLIREMHRVVIVGVEGFGKSWALRQFAACTAYGIHPLRFTIEQPLRTLLVDAENPEDAISENLERLLTQAHNMVGRDTSPVARIWHRQGGIDLRTRRDRSELEHVIRKRRPELVCIGPLYKLTRAKASEGWEMPAKETQDVLDDLRARYNFALLIEDHASKGGQGGKQRQLDPYGSSLWLRWPDVALTLRPVEYPGRRFGEVLDVGSFKGFPRGSSDWPQQLHRGTTWPWVGKWDADGGARDDQIPPF